MGEPGGLLSMESHRVGPDWNDLAVAECILWNAGLDDSQAGINIAGRNINNLSYADDTALMAESEEELKSLLIRVEEESGKNWLNSKKLKLKNKIMTSDSISSWQVEGEKWNQWQILFALKSLQMVAVATKLKDNCSLEGELWQT